MECKYCLNLIEESISYDDKIFDYCYDCLLFLLDHQFNNYLTSLKKSDCKKSLINLIKLGAPRYFRDPLINGHLPIKKFKYKDNIIDGKVTNINKDKIKTFNLKLLEQINNVDALDVSNLINDLIN